MREEPAYILTHDVERFSHYETGYSADVAIQNVRMDERLRIFDDKPIDVPDPVIYSGYLPIINTLDFPVADNSWLIMSRQMVDALMAAGRFDYRSYPVVITDSRYLPSQWRDNGGRFRNEMVISGFVAIQLFERLDIFDFELSKYESDPDFPDFIGNVTEYVFKIPPAGLPPIFHIKGEPVKVFISHAGRVALRKAEIRGVEYISLKGIQGGDGMFVDVEVSSPADN